MHDRVWLELGVVDRVHGLQGAVVIRLARNVPLAIIPQISTLFIQSTDTRVPYPILRSSPPTQNGMVVWLDDIKHRDQAQKILGASVWIQMSKQLISSSRSSLESLTDCIGFRIQLVHEASEITAHLVGVQQLPGQIMLEIEEAWGHWLCPYHPSFIESIDPIAQILIMNPPDGLRDLYYSDHEN